MRPRSNHRACSVPAAVFLALVFARPLARAQTPPSDASASIAGDVAWLEAAAQDQEEGGGWSVVVYPNGFVYAYGVSSCCGFHPPMANGWYRVVNVAVLRSLFREATRWLEQHRNDPDVPAPDLNAAFSNNLHTTAGRDLAWGGPASLGLAASPDGAPYGLRVQHVPTSAVPAAIRR